MNRQRLTGILKYDTIIFYIKVINEKWLKQQKDKVSYYAVPFKINYTCYNTLEWVLLI